MDKELANFLQRSGMALEKIKKALDFINLDDGYENENDELKIWEPGCDTPLTNMDIISLLCKARSQLRGALEYLDIDNIGKDS